jgi:hypothetical protein
MRIFRVLSGAALVVAMTLTAFVPVASAASKSNGSQTYSGQFTGTILYTDCATTPPSGDQAGGTWLVTTHGNSATGSFTITVNGEPHVSYVANGMRNVYTTAPVYFVVAVQTMAGPETVTLYKDGHMTYVIAPYDYQGVSCQSVTFPGTGAPQS